MKTIGVLFGMENSFPGALVEHINARNVEGIQAEFVETWRGALDARALRRHRRPHLPRDPVLPGIPQARGAHGTVIINNPFWWSADDKFFDYTLARKARRGRAAHRDPAPQEVPRGHHRGRMRNLEYPAQLGRGVRLHRRARLHEARRRRRLAGRLPRAQSRRVLPRLRPDGRALHDRTRRHQLQGVLPLLRAWGRRSPHHALRAAQSTPRALRPEPAGIR